jgi:uncharacterized membrane protein YeiB
MGVDVARGLAVIGMVGAHVGVTEYFDWARVETWTDLVNGRSAILFAIVAGISIALSTGGSAGIGDRDIRSVRLGLVGRGAAVFLIGVVLELLGTGVDIILTLYGLLFIAVIPLLRWRRRRLLLTAAGIALLGPAVFALQPIVAPTATGHGIDLVFQSTYSVPVWLSLLMVGLALGRSRLDRPKTAVALLVLGVLTSAVGYGAEALAAPIAEARPAVVSSSSADGTFAVSPEDVDFDGLLCDVPSDGWVSCYPESSVASTSGSAGSDAGSGSSASSPLGDPFAIAWESGLLTEVLLHGLDASEHSGGTAEILGSGGFGVAVLAICLLLSRPLRWVLLPIAALGSMPLSAYSAHIVVILVVAGTAGTSTDNSFWLALTGGLLVATTAWTHFFGRGPLERLVGRVSAAFADPASGHRSDVVPSRCG